MQATMNRHDWPDLDTLADVISRSQIKVPATGTNETGLPAGFDEADIAILEWIAAEGRRSGHSHVRDVIESRH